MEYKRTADVIVIGGGIVGLSTALHLMDAGAKVTVIEGGRIGGAQSAGLVRLAQPHLDGHLRDHAIPAIEQWEALERRWSRRLLGREGLLAALTPPLPATSDNANNPVEHVPLSTAQFPALSDDATGTAVLQRRGGTIRAARAIELLTAALQPNLVSGHVLGIAEHPGLVSVTTTELCVSAPHVVVCAGAATPGMAAAHGVTIPVQRDLHVRLTFAVRDTLREHVQQRTLPGWVDRRPESPISVYGIPVGRTGHYAVGILGRDADVPLPHGSAIAGTHEVDAMHQTSLQLIDYAQTVLPGLIPAPVFERHCIVTHLPWSTEHMATWSSDGGGIRFVAGNNMFMFAPLIGSTMADVVARGATVPTWLDPSAHEAAN